MSATDGVGYFCVVHEREATKPVTPLPPLEIDIRPGQQLVFLRKQEILAFFLSRHLYKLFSRPSRVLKLSKLSRRRGKRGERDA